MKKLSLPHTTSSVIILILFVLIVVPPFCLGTRTYPVAIVSGNSMFPNFQQGDVVFFKGVQSPSTLENNTVIVFVQSTTGNPILDSISRPIVIHRIVGIVTQADGTVYYRTKGDNNQLDDPQLVKASNVLGTPVAVVPKIGLVFDFAVSPQGLVAILAVFALFYFERNETNQRRTKGKRVFLGVLAQMALRGQLPKPAFRELEIAVNYSEDLELEGLDPLTRDAVSWIIKGGLQNKWSLSKINCPKCSYDEAFFFEGESGNVLVICPRCVAGKNIVRSAHPKRKEALHEIFR